MIHQIFLDLLIRFENVDRQNDQAFVSEFFGYVVDEGGFCLAVLAPGGPEFEQYHLTFDRRVVELIPCSSLGAEAGSGLAGFITGERTESCQEQQVGQNEPGGEVSRSHAAEL